MIKINMQHFGDKGAESGKSGGARNYQEIYDDSIFDSSVAKWESDITNGEKDATIMYTGSAYRKWNRALRNDDGYGWESETGNLDKSLGKFSLKQNIVTYRGLSDGAMLSTFGSDSPSIDRINAMKGMVVSDKAFLSTSISKSVASGSFFSDGYMFKINVPKGKGRGAYVDKISINDGEKEFLMPRNTKLKITGAYVDNNIGRTIITVDYVK